MTAVAGDGQRAYVGVGPGLVVYDLAAASGPTEVGRSGPLLRAIHGLALGAGVVYVLSEPWGGDQELVIVDVGDPRAPRAVSRTPLRYCRHVLARDGFLYLDDYNGLTVLDVHDPTAPREVASLAGLDVEGEGVNISLVGSRLYYSVLGGTTIIDVSRPDRPTVLGRFAASRIQVTGNDQSVLILDDDSRLQVLDVHNPADVRAQDSLAICSEDGGQLASDGGTAVVLCPEGELAHLDVHDPARPRLVGKLAVLRSAAWPSLVGDQVLMTGASGLLVAALSLSAPPVLREGVAASFSVDGLALLGRRLLVLDNALERLWVMAIDDPQAPAPVTWMPLGGPAGMVASGTLAYLLMPGRNDTSDHIAVLALDDSDPLTEVGGLALPAGATGIVLASGLLFVSYRFNGLVVYDVRDPAAPRRLSALRLGDELGGPAVLQHYVLLPSRNTSGSTSNLLVVDVADPRRPVQVAAMPMVEPRSVTVHGSLAAVSSRHDIITLDLTDPLRPAELGRLWVNLFDFGVTWIDDYAVLTGLGTAVVDLADPQVPRWLWTTRVWSTSAVAARGFLYIGAGAGGIYVSRIDGPRVAAAQTWGGMGSLPLREGSFSGSRK